MYTNPTTDGRLDFPSSTTNRRFFVPCDLIDFDESNGLHTRDNYSENRGNVFATMPSTNKKLIIYTNLCRTRLDLTNVVKR